MQLILRWIANAIALIITVYIGHVLGLKLGFEAKTTTQTLIIAFEAALVFGLVNAFVTPILKAIALPVTCLTLGLFSLVINAFMFWVISLLVHGFIVHGPAAALFGSICMSIFAGGINAMLQSIWSSKDRD